MINTEINAGAQAGYKLSYSKPCSIVTSAKQTHQVTAILNESGWVARLKAEEGGLCTVVNP